MNDFDHPVARRTILTMAGLSVGAGLISGKPSQAAAAAPDIWSAEYWAKKGDVPLYIFRKRLGAPKPGEPARPVLFLVHGSSVTWRTFDIDAPGHGEYSLMNVFARWGFDVWTMDHENYGKSGRTSGNSDIASGAQDLKAAMQVVVHETGQQQIHFMGESSGALRAGLYATIEPERVGRLVLAAFTYKGTASPTLQKRAEQLEFYRTHNMRKRDRAMIESIFTRDRPGTTDPAVGKVLADVELQYGDQVPTGTYLDMTANLPIVDPKKVQAPVLLIRGEYDGIATVEDIFDFYRQLPTGDKQLVVLPNTAHSVAVAINRQLFWHAMREFLSMPKPVSI
ncbi:MAG TPA: alpha/beta fold hydrolase [Pseudolabrys sp.]|jgi:alpha-beta hydrolase superfamily lysophospholipase